MDEKILQSKTQPFDFTLAKQHHKVEFHTPQPRIANPIIIKVEEHQQSTPVFRQPQPITRNVVVRNPQSIQIKFHSKAPEPVQVVPIFSSTNHNIIRIQEKEENKVLLTVNTIQTS